MQKKVIDRKYLPAKIPLTGTMVWWLVLDKLDAPGWVWGVVGTFCVVFLVGNIIAIAVQEPADPFKG